MFSIEMYLPSSERNIGRTWGLFFSDCLVGKLFVFARELFITKRPVTSLPFRKRVNVFGDVQMFFRLGSRFGLIVFPIKLDQVFVSATSRHRMWQRLRI
jgi:hypothetical protein